MRELLFFNNKGEQVILSSTPSKDYYSGTVFLESSSVGLYASESLHVVERKGDRYGYPESSTPITADTEFSAIKFYQVDSNSTISMSDTLELDPVAGLPETSLRINYLIEGQETGVYTDYIYIRIDSILVCLTVHAEFVGEDDRLVDLLSNIGEEIGEEEYRILRNTDLNNAGLDYSILNAKRKEFLLEAHNIKPYVGSYKGVINILKFFGYGDLEIKEYWKNIKTGIGSYETIHSYEKHGQNIINGTLQKTAMFGLFYDVTVPVGWDETGTPIRKKNFTFSNDEIILKLFALQRYISNKGIGGTSKLVDIVGQHYFYSTNLVSTWIDRTKSTTLTVGTDLKVDVVSDRVGYLTDLRNDLLSYYDSKGTDLVQDWNPKSTTALGHYDLISAIEWKVKEDRKVIPGHLLRVVHSTFDKTWQDIDVPWTRFQDEEEDYTWEKMFYLDYYAVEWRVSMQGGKTIATWDYSETQAVKTINELELVLPYAGTYAVECRVLGYGGVMLSKTEYVEVRVPEVDFYHLYRYQDPTLQRWVGLKYLTWQDMEGDYDSVVNSRRVTPLPERLTTYSTTVAGYYTSLVGTGRLSDVTVVSWKELGKTTWDQTTFLTWEACTFCTSANQKVIIDSVEPGGGTLMLNGISITIPPTITTLKDLCEFLVEAGMEEAIRGQINYREADQGHEFLDVVITTHDNGKAGMLWGSDCCGIISDIGKNAWDSYSVWDSWRLWDSLTWELLKESCIPTPRPGYFTPTTTIAKQSSSVIPPLTTIFFTPDASSLVAPEWFKWELLMGEVVIASSDTELWSYTFITPGTYSVRLIIRDRNNNAGTKLRQSLITVLTTEAFTQYLIENKNAII